MGGGCPVEIAPGRWGCRRVVASVVTDRLQVLLELRKDHGVTGDALNGDGYRISFF